MSYLDVLDNEFVALDIFRKPDLVFGVLQYVLLEVIVSKLLRMPFKGGQKSWFELFFIHLISIPFMGGLSGLFEPEGDYDEDVSDLIIDGTKGIPAVFVGQYIVNVAIKGLHVPTITMFDLLMTAASKTVTRPIAGLLYKNVFPDSIKLQWDDLSVLLGQQNMSSNLKREEDRPA